MMKSEEKLSKAQELKRRKYGVKLDEENEKGTVFSTAKQTIRKNRHVLGGGCVKDKQQDSGQ